MTMLFCDSFDHVSSAAELLRKWHSAVSTSGTTIPSSGGRRNGGYLSMTSGTQEWRYNLQVGVSTIIVGCAIRTDTLANAATGFLNFEESGVLHMSLRYQLNGSIAVYRGSTLLANSAAALISINTWYYLEFKATIHDTTGSYEVRLDGTPIMTASGSPAALDTRNAGTSGLVDTIMLTGHTSATDRWDDLYVNSTAGSRNFGFLGDVRVDAYRPSGAGNSSQFTNNGGSPSIANYLQVDDATPDDGTTYVETATINNIDTYAVTDMSHTPAAIYAVQVSACAAKSDAGSRGLNTVTRRGSTNYHSATRQLQDSYRYISEIRESDPGAASPNDWTKTNLNAAEFGIRVPV